MIQLIAYIKTKNSYKYWRKKQISVIEFQGKDH